MINWLLIKEKKNIQKGGKVETLTKMFKTADDLFISNHKEVYNKLIEKNVELKEKTTVTIGDNNYIKYKIKKGLQEVIQYFKDEIDKNEAGYRYYTLETFGVKWADFKGLKGRTESDLNKDISTDLLGKKNEEVIAKIIAETPENWGNLSKEEEEDLLKEFKEISKPVLIPILSDSSSSEDEDEYEAEDDTDEEIIEQLNEMKRDNKRDIEKDKQDFLQTFEETDPGRYKSLLRRWKNIVDTKKKWDDIKNKKIPLERIEAAKLKLLKHLSLWKREMKLLKYTDEEKKWIKSYYRKKIPQKKGGKKRNYVNIKKVRKHRGIVQNGGNKGRLRKGYKFSGKKTKTGLAIILKISKK